MNSSAAAVPVAFPPLRGSRCLRRALWAIPVGFFVCQCVVVAADANGPFLDEAVNATAGLQILRGQAGDFGWLGGSVYLFPLLSGAAYSLGGLAGARILTALLYSLALWLFAQFVTRMFGRAPAFFAAALLAINGIFFSIAHLAVYDALSIFAVCGAAWASVEIARRGTVRWAVVAGLFGALAVVAKYPSVIALCPVVGLALTSGRSARRFRLIGWSFVIAAAAVVIYMLLAHGFLVPRVALAQAVGEPALFDRPTLGYQVVYALSLPLALAIAGSRRLFRERPALVLVLLGGSLPWPLLHVVMERYVSLAKDSAFGFIELYPLAGLGLTQLWRERRRALAGVLAMAAAWGICQGYWQDHSWADIRPVVQFIGSQLRSSDRVALEYGWDFSMYAVLDHRLPSSSSVIDRYQYEHGADVCDATWIVGTRRSPSDLSDPLVRAGLSCGFELAGTFPYDFYAPLPPLIRHPKWEYQVFRQSTRGLPEGRTSVDGGSYRP